MYWSIAEELKEVKVENRDSVKIKINGETPSLATIYSYINKFDLELKTTEHNIKWSETLMKSDHLGVRFVIELRQGNNQKAQYVLNQFKLCIDEILELGEIGAGYGCIVNPTEYKKGGAEVQMPQQAAEQGYVYLANELKERWANLEFMLQISITKKHIINP